MLRRLVLLLCLFIPPLSADWRAARRKLRAARIPRRQVCVGCGNRVKVEIRFDPRASVMVCQCPICLAMWGYNPVVKPDKWATLPRVEE